MHPAAAGAAAAEAASGPLMDVRAAARANAILGLAVAAIALLAATINPGGFHAQTIEQAAPAPAPASGAQRCAATAAEALALRGGALELVLMGVVQAVFAAAAEVAVARAGVGLLRALGLWFAAAAHVMGAGNVWSLCYVVNGAAVVAIGYCAGEYLAYHVIGYVLVAMSYAVLLGVSLAVTCCR